MIAIVDFGMGNLRSVEKAIRYVGGRAQVTDRPAEVSAADAVILPGVGAFGDAMDNLRSRLLIAPIMLQIRAGRPVLGICLGMQLLFQESNELGRHSGLGVFPGSVLRFRQEPASPDADSANLRVPHVGWNELRVRKQSPLFRGVEPNSYAYFVHSYYVQPADPATVLATTDYGVEFVSVVGRANVFGTQFHPEKSQDTGLQMLRNFVDLCEE